MLCLMRLKIVESFDQSFTLAPVARDALYKLLTGDSFCQQICGQAQCDRVEFTHMLFQPAPYTSTETKGMPAEFEKYHESPDYVIVNVPPNFMFQAKIFNPSRICAIYKKVHDSHS